MQYLLKCLVYIKAVLLPPFAALVIWTLTSFSSSFVRFYPMLVSFITVNLTSYDTANNQYTNINIRDYVFSSVYYVCKFMEMLIVSLNYWLPMEQIVNVMSAAVLASLLFFLYRVFIKLVTVGQV